ncbi:MAG: hypothetical protein Q9163_003767 [Psora crenata]
MATPGFSSLPLSTKGPPLNAWGRFGPDDQLGTLNLITPSVLAAAAKTEIRTGVRVSLDWPLSTPAYPSYGRNGLKHEIHRRGPEGRVVNDDILEFNTQGSSQWDGLRHYEISCSGGITGRGILLDYASWVENETVHFDPLTSMPIPLTHLKQLQESHDITISPGGGDILFIRSGYTAAFNTLSISSQRQLSERPSPDFAGVEATSDVLRWIWDSKFAAVAGDMPSFERSPLGGGINDAYKAEEVRLEGVGSLHEVLLGGWGCPIGEQFDLEKLADMCKKEGRWSFFVSSVPLKVPGGVASPPNAVAIF